MQYLTAVILLFAFWVVMSGHFTPFLLGAGLASAVAVVLFARRMAVIEDSYPVRLGAAALLYWPWLAWEIVKSSWDVALIIVHPRLPISPRWVRVRSSQRSTMGRVTYANSITLTPGTITLDAEGEEFLVHALTRAGAEGLLEGEMDRRVTRFEGRG